MPKIIPCLWFDTQAEEAAQFYCSIFPNSRISRFDEVNTHGKTGSVMTVLFELDGQQYLGLNGGPFFKFTEAISLSIDCPDQAAVDHYWDKLSEGGSPSECGWLKDKYGLSWQVVPSIIPETLTCGDAGKIRRLTEVLLKMTTKPNVDELKRACEGQ